MHNQNPYYSFRGFPDMAAMNAHGLAGGITYGHVTLATLRRWGSTIDWQVVRPAVLPIFRSDRPSAGRSPTCRASAGEAEIVRQLLHGIHPDLAGVPWVEINDMSRPQVSELLAQSLVFASLSRLEGLGLPPLEAMAAGCLVCGYDGFGGREFARPDNGFWVPDGDVEAFAEAIATALRLDAPTAATYVAAGRAMAASFSQERFHDELAAAWHHLLGDRWADYQVATA